MMMDTYPSTLQLYFKALARRAGSQKVLAERIGYSTSYVGDLIQGNRGMTAAVCDIIAKQLELQDQERDHLHRIAARFAGYRV